MNESEYRLAYRLERSAQFIKDLELIFDHLIESYQSFGEPLEDACQHAAKRILKLEESFEQIAAMPHQGTLRPDLLPGLRNVTKDRAIIYFDVDDKVEQVRLLAVFYGGQDHQRHMLKRMLQI